MAYFVFMVIYSNIVAVFGITDPSLPTISVKRGFYFVVHAVPGMVLLGFFMVFRKKWFG